jgi:hypothetical protein
MQQAESLYRDGKQLLILAEGSNESEFGTALCLAALTGDVKRQFYYTRCDGPWGVGFYNASSRRRGGMERRTHPPWPDHRFCSNRFGNGDSLWPAHVGDRGGRGPLVGNPVHRVRPACRIRNA